MVSFYTLHILISTVIALLVSWAFLAYVIWTKPNEVIVHDPPTAEDIAKATAPIIAERDAAIKERNAARQELDTAQQELTAAQQELDTARRSVIPPPAVLTPQPQPRPQPEWSAQEIAARIDLWHSIQNAVNDVSFPAGPVVAAYNYGDFALNIWVTYLPKNRPDYLGGLKEFRKKVSEAADGVQKIRRDYPNFKDVSETIDQSYLGPLLDSIDNLSTAISALPEPLPANYETTLRPLVGAVRMQMNNFNDWISNVQSTSKAKLKQLQILSHK